MLIDRYNALTEDTVEAFTEANNFRRLPDDNVATNPAVRFRVETFEPSEGFQPRKPYQSRLKWRDQDGNEQSKLLLTKTRDGDCRGLARRSGTSAGSAGNAVRSPCPAASRPQAGRARRPARLTTRPRLTRTRPPTYFELHIGWTRIGEPGRLAGYAD